MDAKKETEDNQTPRHSEGDFDLSEASIQPRRVSTIHAIDNARIVEPLPVKAMLIMAELLNAISTFKDI